MGKRFKLKQNETTVDSIVAKWMSFYQILMTVTKLEIDIPGKAAGSNGF